MVKKVSLTTPKRGSPTMIVKKSSKSSVDPVGEKKEGGYGEIHKYSPNHPPPNSLTPNSKKVQVSELLAELSPAEKKELLDQLALEVNKPLGSSSDSKGRDVEMWSHGVHQALVKVTGGSYGVLMVRKTLSPAANWNPVRDFMVSSKLAECSVSERQGVYNLLGDLLVAHAVKVCSYKSLVVSPKIVANCTTSIAGVFDNAFPGYLASGLAKVVVKQLTRAV